MIQNQPGEEGLDGFVKVERVATFVDPEGQDLPSGTTVPAKLTNVRKSSENAIALEVLDEQS